MINKNTTSLLAAGSTSSTQNNFRYNQLTETNNAAVSGV